MIDNIKIRPALLAFLICQFMVCMIAVYAIAKRQNTKIDTLYSLRAGNDHLEKKLDETTITQKDNHTKDVIWNAPSKTDAVLQIQTLLSKASLNSGLELVSIGQLSSAGEEFRLSFEIELEGQPENLVDLLNIIERQKPNLFVTSLHIRPNQFSDTPQESQTVSAITEVTILVNTNG